MAEDPFHHYNIKRLSGELQDIYRYGSAIILEIRRKEPDKIIPYFFSPPYIDKAFPGGLPRSSDLPVHHFIANNITKHAADRGPNESGLGVAADELA